MRPPLSWRDWRTCSASRHAVLGRRGCLPHAFGALNRVSYFRSPPALGQHPWSLDEGRPMANVLLVAAG